MLRVTPPKSCKPREGFRHETASLLFADTETELRNAGNTHKLADNRLRGRTPRLRYLLTPKQRTDLIKAGATEIA